LVAPARTSLEPAREEVVEDNRYYLWQRFHLPDPEWPRVIESRIDAAAGCWTYHYQRCTAEDQVPMQPAWHAAANVLRKSCRSTSSRNTFSRGLPRHMP
jgi:hypothetical protein